MTGSIELVRGLYAAFAAGDVQRFLDQLAHDVAWNEAEGFPYADGNPYLGVPAVAALLARLAADWRDFHVEVRELAGGPEVVTMLGRYRATHARSGRALDAQAAHTWWLRDGKVARFQQMVDTAAVSRALGARA